MCNRMFIVGMGVVVAGLLWVGESAQAVIVSVNGTTVFDSGGFEFDSTGGAPTTPATGAYFSTPNTTVVAGGTPGPFDGLNYVSATRPGSAATGLSGSISASVAAGDVIRVSAWAYLDSAQDQTSLMNIRLRGDDGVGNTDALFLNMGNYASTFTNPLSVWYASGGGFPETGSNFYQLDTWQLWELEYDLGTGLAQFSVDGVLGPAFTPTTALTPTTVIETWDVFNGAPGKTLYLDGVIPEPATLGLLGIGGALMLLRRRP